MKTVARLLLVAILACPFYALAARGADTMPGDSLYKQLGGYDGLAAFTDDFIKRLATDPKLTKFFRGLGDAHKARIRQMFLDFMCEKTGGPCVYVGEDMKKVHSGMNVTDDDWNAAVADMVQTMNTLHVSPDLQKKLGDLVGKVKPEIVIPGK
jgi:hemoglobin